MKCSICKKSSYSSKEDALGSLKHQQSLGNLKKDFLAAACNQCESWVISKNTPFSATCNKNIYKSKSEAEKAKKHSEKETGSILNIYYCESCKGYHLTKKQIRF